jgi:hypothetical protein
VAIKQGKIASLMGLEGYVDTLLVVGAEWTLNRTERTCLGTPLVVSDLVHSNPEPNQSPREAIGLTDSERTQRGADKA